jgi:hypothetical protein
LHINANNQKGGYYFEIAAAVCFAGDFGGIASFVLVHAIAAGRSGQPDK